MPGCRVGCGRISYSLFRTRIQVAVIDKRNPGKGSGGVRDGHIDHTHASFIPQMAGVDVSIN